LLEFLRYFFWNFSKSLHPCGFYHLLGILAIT
jgi:hypothetical protein